MTSVLYYISVFFLKAGVYLSALFSGKSRRLIAGQWNVFRRIKSFARHHRADVPCFWFHCASLGEFEQGRPVMEALKQAYPAAQIVLTFFSPSGYEVRYNYAGADLVSYLPLDGWRNARRFVRLIQPTVAFFVKYEYWYGYISALHQRKIPALSVSTLLLPDKIPFRWYGGWYRRMLRRMNHFFVQDTTTAELLREINIHQITQVGDTRFDRAAALCREAEPVALAAAFAQDETVFVVGSNWPPDTDVLLPLLQEFAAEIKFIIAPHEIDEVELARIEAALPGQTVRYSRAQPETVASYRVLLIDNVGMLTSLYRYGSFAYVGGAFGKSLHNVLEPATFGMPIYFGNRRYRHVGEASTLVERGGAFPVANYQELRRHFLGHYRHEEQQQSVAELTRRFVVNHTGATDKIIQYVETMRVNNELWKV